MAKSESHKLGEFIGAFFEETMKKPVRELAEKHNLFFDSSGKRKARKGKKVTWVDINGSNHDLDFVIEKNGNENIIGEPVAFIELAWRSYTRHSKNKAQEIAGAINPICEKYKLCKPFKGAILSGVFTESSINQLRNDDFHVLYIPFKKIAQAFNTNGLNIDFDEKTKETDIKKMFNAVSKKSNKKKLELVRKELLKTCNPEIMQFITELESSLTRIIKSICILPLHGKRIEVFDIDKAINYIESYQELPKDSAIEYIEVIVTYNNGSIIQGQFKSKQESVDFLKIIN